MPPGMTRRPEASIVRAAPSMRSAIVMMRPARIPTSARYVSLAVTMVPPRTARSKSGIAGNLDVLPEADPVIDLLHRRTRRLVGPGGAFALRGGIDQIVELHPVWAS